MQESVFRTLARRLIDSVLHPLAITGQWSDLENRAHTHPIADITNLQTTLDAASTRAGDIETSVSTLDGEVDTLTASVSATFGQYNTRVGALETYTGAGGPLRTRLDTIEGNATTAQTAITTINQKDTDQDGLLSGLRTDVNINTSGLAALNTKVDNATSEDDLLYLFYLG